ncbi:MAG: glycosyltransferase [Pseudomonadota bacterium]
MFIAKQFVFLELHKTGSTQIRQLLQEFANGRTDGAHNTAPAELFDGRRFFVGSIRNPWEWYVSLWAHGCDRRGGAWQRAMKIAPNEWAPLYADANDIQAFRAWLQKLHNPDAAHEFDAGYGSVELRRFSGLLSYRFLRLYCVREGELSSLHALRDLDQLLEFESLRGFVDIYIRNERLKQDVVDLLAYCGRALSGVEQRHVLGMTPANASSRGADWRRYYDQACIELVADRERLIIDRFGYAAPATPVSPASGAAAKASGTGSTLSRPKKRWRIFVPPVPDEYLIGELKDILIDGVLCNPRTQLCDRAAAADLILLDFRHLQHDLYELTHPEKTVVIDYRDQWQHVFPQAVRHYFKRTVVRRMPRDVATYDRDVDAISYCVRRPYLGRRGLWPAQRDIDVAVFFPLVDEPGKSQNVYRSLVARTVADNFDHLKLFVGVAGKLGEEGSSGFNPEYYRVMARAKIVVTCNPDRWDGEYSLFEALSSGALVMSDAMLTQVVQPFVNHRHLVYYNRHNMDSLLGWIRFYLENEATRARVAMQGYQHALAHHKPADRIDEILNKFEAGGGIADEMRSSPETPRPA